MKIILCAFVACCMPWNPVAAQDTHSPPATHTPTIVVDGTGEVSNPPDMATVNVGVTATGDTAQQALETNNAEMQALLNQLKSLKIEARDIQTSNFNVSPQYEQQQARIRDGNLPQIIGYRVSNQVHVRIRDLKSLGATLDQMIVAGANQINGIAFSIDDSEKMLDEARGKAVMDAARKAKLLAASAGVELGPIVEIRESSDMGSPYPMRGMAMMEARSSVPIQTGEQTLTARVRITYAMSNNARPEPKDNPEKE